MMALACGSSGMAVLLGPVTSPNPPPGGYRTAGRGRADLRAVLDGRPLTIESTFIMIIDDRHDGPPYAIEPAGRRAPAGSEGVARQEVPLSLRTTPDGKDVLDSRDAPGRADL